MFLYNTSLLFLISSWWIGPAQSFLATPFQRIKSNNNNNKNNNAAILQLNANTPGGEGGDGLDSLKKMLETSWNIETMGKIPSDPIDSAEEAVAAITSAKTNGVDIFFVDLLLPSYDVKQGTEWYDEVMAVEYCIEIANRLESKSSILVRNGNTLESVGRVLDARERERMREQERLVPDISPLVEEEEEEVREDEESEDDDDDVEEAEDDLGVEASDAAPGSDIDSFRQQLMSTWDLETTEPSIEEEPVAQIEEEKPKAPPTPPKEDSTPDAVIGSSGDAPKKYRLASLFGDTKISSGADMMQNVVDALRLNALPEEDEGNLIILSAISREEMVAVRTLVDKYEGIKNIILVNCKLDPLPNELRRGDTVYSILPLLAKQTQGGDDAPPPPPKIVVMRRFPSNWEVFVDVGTGFQLAETAPVFNKRISRGPPMDWVTECVQRYVRRNTL